MQDNKKKGGAIFFIDKYEISDYGLIFELVKELSNG